VEVDKYNFREVILNSVKQLDVDFEFFSQLRLMRRPFKKIVFCGMGGSALVGDFFSYFKNKNYLPLLPKLPIIVHRSYDLPDDVDENSLIICLSYSGQTEETISAFNRARAGHLEIAGVTCGGKLAELFEQNKIPWVKIPRPDIPPRASLGYQLGALVKILMAYGLLSSWAQNEISALSQKISPASSENAARDFCVKLANKMPVIYASTDNELLARLFKIKFNENTKIPSFYNSIPELNHNEMVGWTRNLGPFYFLFLRDSDDLPRIKKRMDLTADLLRKSHLPLDFIDLKGLTPLEKLFWASAFGDWLSYHLALFYGVDPTPVEIVEEFKKKMNE
jgi:glucose/mannose-6-phosphate isomerase